MKCHLSKAYSAILQRVLHYVSIAKVQSWMASKVGHSGSCVFAVVTYLLLGNQFASAQSPSSPDTPIAITKAAPSIPVMPLEDRLPYLRKLKTFLEADPLDMAEFERQFDLKLECRSWRSTGKICEYRAEEARWPYAEFKDKSSVVSFSIYGDGTADLLWISLMYSGDRRAYNCITGPMVQQVFTPPEWTAVVDKAVSHVPSPHPSEVLLLALHGQDRKHRSITIVTTGVTRCTGTLQITVHPTTR